MRPTLFVAALLFTSTGETQTFTAAQARMHDGETATICGVVASERTAVESKGKPTFINLDSAYPDAVFTVVIWGEDRQKVEGRNNPKFAITHVCERVDSVLHGVPQIIVRTRGQISPQ
jgi:hypothetical protein